MRTEPAHGFDPGVRDARMLAEAEVVLGCEVESFTPSTEHVGDGGARPRRRLECARVVPQPVTRSALDVIVETFGPFQKVGSGRIAEVRRGLGQDSFPFLHAQVGG